MPLARYWGPIVSKFKTWARQIEESPFSGTIIMRDRRSCYHEVLFAHKEAGDLKLTMLCDWGAAELHREGPAQDDGDGQELPPITGLQ